MDNMICSKIIRAFICRETSLYDVLYLHGEPAKIKPFIDTLEEKYIQKYPSLRVIRTNASDFIKETLAQIRCGEFCDIPQCDLYIFEGVNGLVKLEVTQQRLYGIFDWLLENKRQIVITGAAPIADLELLAPRICAQINGGISLLIE